MDEKTRKRQVIFGVLHKNAEEEGRWEGVHQSVSYRVEGTLFV